MFTVSWLSSASSSCWTSPASPSSCPGKREPHREERTRGKRQSGEGRQTRQRETETEGEKQRERDREGKDKEGKYRERDRERKDKEGKYVCTEREDIERGVTERGETGGE